ncbi:MAG: hypothetical protein EOP04_32315, partial [Proteobacteria bacterium]
VADTFAAASQLIKSVERRTLIHGDFHFGNLLYEGERISGILDFEWSCAGDPLFDLCKLRDMESTWNDSQQSFLWDFAAEFFPRDVQNLHTMCKISTSCLRIYLPQVFR